MNRNLQDFIKHSDSQKEVSLAVAKDEQELDQFKSVLDSNGYKEARDVAEILEDISGPVKVYYSIEETFPKSLYDLILQYPTGQVEIFDFSCMKSTTVNPVYQNSSIILLITKDNLSHFQKKGYPILQNVGIAYKS